VHKKEDKVLLKLI